MPVAEELYTNVIKILEAEAPGYQLFQHRAALTYEELEAVQRECGYVGKEMKCMVLKLDQQLVVYVTLQGARLDFGAIKNFTNSKKVRLATVDELQEYFAAEPGCAYPFGFAFEYPIYIDPQVFSQEELVFSPVLSTRTVQIKGAQFKKVMHSLPNQIIETDQFNKKE